MFPSLYIHVPFCSLKCDYCDFYSKAAWSDDYETRYLFALERQLEYGRERWNIQGFSTVYVGGGTPSVLSSEGISHLIHLFLPLLAHESVEITFEANPESLSREKISLLEESCVNRISMGVQSFFPDTRRFLGRRGTVNGIYTALDNLEELWSGRFSIDLIRGLPGDFQHDLRKELKNINTVRLDHLSLYDLTVEAGTPLSLRQGMEKMSLSEGTPEDYSFLAESGFQRYEVSNFSRPGAESRHNQGYWEMNPYIGLGPSAVSLMYYGGPKHISVAPSLETFLSGSPNEYLNEEPLNMADLFIEHLIMGFRQIRGLSLASISTRFGKELSEIIPVSLDAWVQNAMCVIQGGRVCLTGKAFSIQNRLVLEAWEEIDNGKPFA